jgi:probable HAF family extracellular repeat protein
LVELAPLPPDGSIDQTEVTALNDRGTAVGNLLDVSGPDTGSTVFVWRDGRLVLLPPSGEDTRCDQVVALNERGQTAGLTDAAAEDRCHAALRSARGDIVDLGTLGGTSSGAAAINDHGQVVGSADLPGDAHRRAVLWERGRTVDLGTPAGTDDSEARAVNERGQVAGYGISADSTVSRAFLSVPGRSRG